MQFGFNTESVNHGKAALLLYAMYRSRELSSSLKGLETWERCSRFIRGAVLKASTVAEFVQQFCKMADVQTIKPHYLKTDGLVEIDDIGTLAQVDGLYNYQLELFENQEILDLFNNESMYLIMLVRERIQREREVFNYEA